MTTRLRSRTQLERPILEFETLGIDKVILSGATAGADPVEARKAAILFDEQVLPAFGAP